MNALHEIALIGGKTDLLKLLDDRNDVRSSALF